MPKRAEPRAPERGPALRGRFTVRRVLAQLRAVSGLYAEAG